MRRTIADEAGIIADEPVVVVDEIVFIADEPVVFVDIESLTPVSDLPDVAHAAQSIAVKLETTIPPLPEPRLASRFDEPSAKDTVLASKPAVAVPADDVALAETAAAPVVELVVEPVTSAAMEHPFEAAGATVRAILLAEHPPERLDAGPPAVSPVAPEVPTSVASVPAGPVVALTVDHIMLAEREAPVPPAQTTPVIDTLAVPAAVRLSRAGGLGTRCPDAGHRGAHATDRSAAQMPPHETDVLSAAWESAVTGAEASSPAPLSQDLPIVREVAAADPMAEEPSSIVSTVPAPPPETQTTREDEPTDFLLEPMRLPVTPRVAAQPEPIAAAPTEQDVADIMFEIERELFAADTEPPAAPADSAPPAQPFAQASLAAAAPVSTAQAAPASPAIADAKIARSPADTSADARPDRATPTPAPPISPRAAAPAAAMAPTAPITPAAAAAVAASAHPPSPARPAAKPMPRPAPNYLLAALRAMSDEERIALFT